MGWLKLWITRTVYNESNQIKFKTSITRSYLCDYSDAYIHVNETIEIKNRTARGAASNNRNKGVTVKDCAQFINGIIRINNAQVDDAHDIHAVMSMYNLLEFSNIYSKTSEILWQ